MCFVKNEINAAVNRKYRLASLQRHSKVAHFLLQSILMNRAVSFSETICQMTGSPFTHVQAVFQVILEEDLLQAEVRQ